MEGYREQRLIGGIKIKAMQEALEEALSLLKGEKKFPEDLTIWGPGGKNVVRINEVIGKCKKALRLMNEEE